MIFNFYESSIGTSTALFGYFPFSIISSTFLLASSNNSLDFWRAK